VNQPPPHSLDIEAAVLSACLLDSGLLDELRDVVQPADFYAYENRTVWEAACSLVDGSRPVDAVTVAAELRDRGKLEQVGGVPYIAQIIDATPAIHNVHEHARTVAELAQRRRVIDVAKRVAVEGYGDVGDAGKWFEEVESAIFAATTNGREASESSLLRELATDQIQALSAKFDSGDAVEFATISWLTLRQKLCGGWRRGKFHVMAGRPGMGKTAAALRCAAAAAKAGEGVVVISLEMTRDELTQRLLASEANVSLSAIMSGSLRDDDWSSVTSAATDLSAWPMSLTYCPGAKVSKLRSVIRREMARLRRVYGVETTLVVVDYLQLVNGERRKGDSRESEVSDICRHLTALAGELDVAMVCLSQLNRDLEKRQDKRPQLSDLRESGAIEQDAYSVSFLYRDEYYHKGTSEPGIVEWILAKHRNGSLGTVRMRWDGSCVRLDDVSTQATEYDDWFGG